MASQAGFFTLQQFTDAGALLVAGRLYTYAQGTTTLKTAYTDLAGTVPQTYTADGLGGQYIALNARAELPAPLYLGSGSYDVTLKRADGSTVWTRQADPTSDVAVALSASMVADLANTSLVSKGPALLGLNATLNYAAGTVGQGVVDRRVSIRDAPWAAKGDWNGATGTDDTAAIQACITWVGSRGGGVVLIPSGFRFLFTSTLYMPANVTLQGDAMPGFFYPSTGSKLVAKFANPNAWAIESDTRKASDLTRVDYRDAFAGAAIDAAQYNRNENVGLRNLYIEASGALYGGVRLMGCPGYVRDAVGVIGTDIGFLACASWGVQDTRLWSLTYLYGYAFVYDVNGHQVSGYFDCLAGKVVTAVNRPNWVAPGDIGPTVGTRDFKDDRIGFFGYYANSSCLIRVVAEHWDVGRALIQCKAVDESGAYSEGNVKTALALIATDYVGGGFRSVNDVAGAATSFYEFGVNASAELTNYPGKPATVSAYARVRVSDRDPDFNGWQWSDYLSYVGTTTNYFKVSSTGAATAIGQTSTYTSLDEALRRIERGSPGKYNIIVKDGDTLTWGASLKPNFEGKDVLMTWEGTTKPTINFTNSAGYCGYPMMNGDCSLTVRSVNWTITGSPSDAYQRGLIGIDGNTRIRFDNSDVNLGAGWQLFWPVFNSAWAINGTWKGGTITGSGSSCLIGSQSGSATSGNVMARQYGCTVSATIKAIGTNGWSAPSTVINSNF